MSDRTNPAELLDVEMDEFARMFPLVAANRRGGFERLDTVEAKAPEDAADRGRRDADRGRDVLARPALAAQSFDGRDCGCRRWPVRRRCSR